MKTVFALVDCNNFYVSCERVFDPRVCNKPMAVLSQNDGCIIARSNEVKKMGVPMGAAAFKWAPFLKQRNVLIYSSNYPLYGDMSDRVIQTLRSLTPHVEQYSIDEAFCELSKTVYAQSHQLRIEHGQLLRSTVLQWTGIPTAIGIGPTKTLAKIATRIAKKNPQFNGVCDLTDHKDSDSILATIAVADVWGVGRQYAEMLARSGIKTARDLKYANDKWVQKKMTIVGLKMVWELRGISCVALEEQPQPKQTIAFTRSFGSSVTSLNQLKQAVAEYVAQAATKMRSQHSIAQAMYVFINTSRFIPDRYSNGRALPLVRPTAYTPELIGQALKALETIYRPGYQYKKAGIIFLDLAHKDHEQQDMFMQKQKSSTVSKVSESLDVINKKWGRKTVFYAAQGIDQPWKVRQIKRSQGFTTNWDELPIVKGN
jgi:DNA polymerase V